MNLLKYIKYFFLIINNFVLTIKNLLVGILTIFKCSILFVKGSIDFIYKILFISFFCLLAYIGYKVFTSASIINKKLNELQTEVVYIQQISEELSKTIKDITEGVNNKVKQAEKIAEKTSKLTGKIKKYGK